MKNYVKEREAAHAIKSVSHGVFVFIIKIKNEEIKCRQQKPLADGQKANEIPYASGPSPCAAIQWFAVLFGSKAESVNEKLIGFR